MISVIIPTHNRFKLTKNSILSVISQKMNQNVECLVIDDGSSDGSFEKLVDYFSEYNFIHFYRNQREKGAQGARNTGLLKSKGDVIVFLDSDDELTENSIKDRLSILENGFEAVYGNTNQDNYMNPENIKLFVSKNLAICPFSVIMIQKRVISNYLLDERFISWQDDDFMFHISGHVKVGYCNKIVANFAPVERNDNITKSLHSRYLGMRLLLTKHKNRIIQDHGRVHYSYCLFRLFILKIKSKIHNDKEITIWTKLVWKIILISEKYLKSKFDIFYV